jgi:hypothetical protein
LGGRRGHAARAGLRIRTAADGKIAVGQAAAKVPWRGGEGGAVHVEFASRTRSSEPEGRRRQEA